MLLRAMSVDWGARAVGGGMGCGRELGVWEPGWCVMECRCATMPAARRGGGGGAGNPLIGFCRIAWL